MKLLFTSMFAPLLLCAFASAQDPASAGSAVTRQAPTTKPAPARPLYRPRPGRQPVHLRHCAPRPGKAEARPRRPRASRTRSSAALCVAFATGKLTTRYEIKVGSILSRKIVCDRRFARVPCTKREAIRISANGCAVGGYASSGDFVAAMLGRSAIRSHHALSVGRLSSIA